MPEVTFEEGEREMRLAIEAAPVIMPGTRSPGVGASITDLDTGAAVQFWFPVGSDTEDVRGHQEACDSVVDIGHCMGRIMQIVYEMLDKYLDEAR